MTPLPPACYQRCLYSEACPPPPQACLYNEEAEETNFEQVSREVPVTLLPSPRPLPRLPVVCPRRARCSLLLSSYPADRYRRTEINKVTLMSHVPTVSLPPGGGRVDGGRAEEGHRRSVELGALTATAGRCRTPAPPRPPGAWLAAPQSPGRWDPAAPHTGSLACSFTHHGDRGHHGGSDGSSSS